MGPDAAAAVDAIAGLRWWHALEVAPGVVTPGPWDLRHAAARMPWPGRGELGGLRCLDVGTMDGFWAFELERRGAAEVVAVDLVDPARHDAPVGEAPVGGAPAGGGHGGQERGRTFRVAAGLLGSRARYVDASVYGLDPAVLGTFDVVVAGYLLQALRDPLRGLEALRRVCRGHLLLLDTVSRPLSLLPAPVARLDARRDGREWFVFNRRGLAKALTLAGFRVEAASGILRDRYRPVPGAPRPDAATLLRHALPLRGRSLALR
ncbi:MAG TPA: methyltransferase domain-containing protein, partial [Acidimicrobiales bacterium]